jgi:hypothetical protein
VLKRFLRALPFSASVKRHLRRLVIDEHGETAFNVLSAFPAFGPNSDGRYVDKASLTIRSINRTFPSLVHLLQSQALASLEPVEIESFRATEENRKAAAKLKDFLDRHGSDKAGYHNYHFLYGALLAAPDLIEAILEIGIGTNNTAVVSHMGTGGKPGASLRAFRDYLGNAQIYGADIDSSILIEEDRIHTHVVDQTDPSSLDRLGAQLPLQLDLVIDDGLHSPDANIETLRFGLERIKVGGWMVVEDIAYEAIPVWQVVSALLPAKFRAHLLSARGGLLFAVQRSA